ncbi:UDP-N-acetylmuramoyl-tripeptide--D-alanyl-D-alanine ligase [Lederbergia citrea]|uniref:UDP-N-acetylmuramoyl-tripeptide--D-alanyl-D-alanine ligase n=1 Tax=Lederbergia citrea TaxID=2833581 RepID=A0A942UPP5_9BACI|nr:UDP-N-acetylmuramoyl-tripeptide--D-alanyl-D-alanine ligase [Lederbergia citrea]MBS4205996.1 UDP-N-acetylmuramoyl-tripeptide--D-alanyl-D-alanine ligase [Lederbergia citrea]MBS4224555.1 UDP-N-acetylmuramoyl-tripeptide--D-alanyl-D-alanine ligase [Lederbergia citrea]
MKPLLVKDIRKLLQGELITGSELWKVRDAIYYNRHDLTNRHTLMFVSRNDSVNWNEINNKGPSLVISDMPASEFKKALPNTTVIKVASLVQSYWKFIDYYRGLFQIPVVTITGTCGKTTTKDMIKHILSKDRNVQASISSKNEPRRSFPYLMGIDERTDAAVFEHGLGNTGNIKHQCMIYQPTIGIITNIGVHHLDGCKNLEGYIKAKSEIVGGIREGGTLILNADDENTKNVPLQSFKGKIIYFGIGMRADFRASKIKFSHRGMKFQFHVSSKTYEAFIPGYGEHQVYNALAALAAVHEMGMDIKEAISRLRTYKNMTRHLEFSSGIGGSTIIDDTWTNNPTSVEAALKVLDSIGKGKNVILVLGDINRLGNFEKKYHCEIGSLVARRNIHTLITIGAKAEDIAKQAIKDGSRANVYMFKDVNGINDILDPHLDDKAILLIKGPMSSRSMIDFANSLKEKQSLR